ncbi:hypothetical protein CK203_024707 [Vitis vinifera]|uniref:Uncharacterized protein n=1 Tax=Vitis vinifera TaxID=29760 RepID=A0A438ITL6_VITVI|nr:hypothetical protein CK203_024707 [Vitis vinifera]
MPGDLCHMATASVPEFDIDPHYFLAEVLASLSLSLNPNSQVYMLKVEGIAFRFLPDPVQIKNALEVSAKYKL